MKSSEIGQRTRDWILSQRTLWPFAVVGALGVSFSTPGFEARLQPEMFERYFGFIPDKLTGQQLLLILVVSGVVLFVLWLLRGLGRAALISLAALEPDQPNQLTIRDALRLAFRHGWRCLMVECLLYMPLGLLALILNIGDFSWRLQYALEKPVELVYSTLVQGHFPLQLHVPMWFFLPVLAARIVRPLACSSAVVDKLPPWTSIYRGARMFLKRFYKWTQMLTELIVARIPYIVFAAAPFVLIYGITQPYAMPRTMFEKGLLLMLAVVGYTAFRALVLMFDVYTWTQFVMEGDPTPVKNELMDAHSLQESTHASEN